MDEIEFASISSSILFLFLLSPFCLFGDVFVVFRDADKRRKEAKIVQIRYEVS